MDKELRTMLAERDALFRNPTLEAAQAFWLKSNFETWKRPDVPLAATHKARLQWLDATDHMLAESIEWLKANGYELTMKGAPPLTPEQRDAERRFLGKPPLPQE
jgi:hypothetical protein